MSLLRLRWTTHCALKIMTGCRQTMRWLAFSHCPTNFSVYHPQGRRTGKKICLLRETNGLETVETTALAWERMFRALRRYRGSSSRRYPLEQRGPMEITIGFAGCRLFDFSCHNTKRDSALIQNMPTIIADAVLELVTFFTVDILFSFSWP
ncbi:hypothetical protein EX30DRAFT_235687 [Ascodesmis nigricans]|uniref:Uncharacterized protein n=1 Tax=Ascodesmis nigricans TaxID=341454 RepID=A0A4S2MYP8_9PEZI|nr:hypothetical protein EX30DRAFT_235687 [Ascodesmis nigricans]